MKRWTIPTLLFSLLALIYMFRCSSCSFTTDYPTTLSRHERTDCKNEKKTLLDAIAKRKRQEELEEEEQGLTSSKKSKGDIPGINTAGLGRSPRGFAQTSLSALVGQMVPVQIFIDGVDQD